MEEAAVAIINAEEGGNDDESTDGMRLVQLLITCVEAVAYRDKSHASALLSELRSSVLVFGSSFQRVASCFVQGIADRLSLVQPLGIVGFIAPMMNIMDISCDKKEETLRLCVGRFQTIGDELMKYAKDLGINLEFWMLESNLENLRPDDIKVFDGEVLLSKTQATMDRSSWEDLWNSVLQMIHALSPKVLVLVEQDSSHNGPFFLGRFMEALHYYSAIFDSLDAMLPRYDNRRAKVE
ncbi:GRAS family protein RAD1-like [Hevea brasiliensis]|uniref:GRAS family protein RAD1-like n=1 Tax=Hevea brasiliensis TaxID=3981 RepID=UPI0025F8B597|nr:GRAS family protein RAD1-like [Hevea brasiliensis]